MSEYSNKPLEGALEDSLSKYSLDPTNIYTFYSVRRLLSQIRKQKAIPFKYRTVARKFGFVDMEKRKPKPRLAFVGHSYHCKTLSSMFFLRELDPFFEIDVYFSKSWMGVPEGYLSNLFHIYKYAIYWQIFPKISHKHPANVIIIPMWDGVSSWSKSMWLKYQNFRFFSFSKVMHEKIKNYGLESIYKQHIPEDFFNVKRSNKTNTLPRVFLWQRGNDITWSTIKPKLIKEQIGQIVLCNSPDPSVQFNTPSLEDIQEYKIELVTWKNSKSEYLEFLDEIDIFIAPRLQEGIGFSFLDAMSKGCVIIYPEEATMNEYLNSEIGFPINYKTSNIININNWQEKSSNMMDYIEKKHKSSCAKKIKNLFGIKKC